MNDISPVPPKKRPRVEGSEISSSEDSCDLNLFRPENTRLVSVLSNDTRSKTLVLRAHFGDDSDKDAIILLSKSSFPSNASDILNSKIVGSIVNKSGSTSSENEGINVISSNASFPDWSAKSVMINDIYHRLSVTAGLESANGIDMTVIYPAEESHIKKYSVSGHRIIQETADMYNDVIVPYLNRSPRDLTWIANIHNGIAEQDRVLLQDADPQYGFTLVLDYKWNGMHVNQIHCLGIFRDESLTCLRDLRGAHVPMLKRILTEGRRLLSAKYSSSESGEKTGTLSEDQILAYMHYPPSFYIGHIHFCHINSDNRGNHTMRAHVVEEVIRNLEMDDTFYRDRTMTIYLSENSPMYEAIKSTTNGKIQSSADATALHS